jgi:hypothetical protein
LGSALLSDGLSEHFFDDVAEVRVETDGIASEVFAIVVCRPEMVNVEAKSRDGILSEHLLRGRR